MYFKNKLFDENQLLADEEGLLVYVFDYVHIYLWLSKAWQVNHLSLK